MIVIDINWPGILVPFGLTLIVAGFIMLMRECQNG